MNKWLRKIVCTALTAGLGVMTVATANAAELQRVADRADPEIAKLVKSDNLVFVSGLVGKSVEDVVKQADGVLKEAGLDIGNMIQHTIYVKDGTPSFQGAIGGFHAATRALAPRLIDKPSTGTILRVPEIGGDNTYALDLMAAAPSKGKTQDDFVRIWFHPTLDGIVETVSPGKELIFTSGMEAMNFSNGTLAPDLDSQVKYIVEK